jgi:hypothetical protein
LLDQLYFQRLERAGDWDDTEESDKIALLAIYMPILRTEFAEFIGIWNYHKIRKQRLRPGLAVGQPWKNYCRPNPSTANWGFSPEAAKVQRLRLCLDAWEWDMDAFLPPAVWEWCKARLELLGHYEERLATPYEEENPFMGTYFKLRDLIRVHIGTGTQPEMGRLKSPIGGIEEFKAIARNVDFSGVDMAEEVEHPFM